MVVKVASTCLHWSQPIVPRSTPSSQTLASSIASPSSKRRNRGGGGDGGAQLCLHVHSLNRSALFGAPSTKLSRSRSWSCGFQKSRFRSIRRACSANLDAFSDEEFSKKIRELALRFQLADNFDGEDDLNVDGNESDSEPEAANSDDNHGVSESATRMRFEQNQSRFQLPLDLEPPWPSDWQRRDEIVQEASIERKANSFDLPLSLRIIKRKMQWQDGFREAGESACCSVKKAFSSMVFIIRELHSYTLQMREILFFEDLQGILSRVQKEMQASFVWLFQQVFSQTPTLMVYVMILLANFTVYSLGHNAAIAAAPPAGLYASATESISVEEVQTQNDKLDNPQFDSSSKSFSVNGNGKTTSVGGNNGGGGKVRPVGSGTDGDGRFDRSDQYRTIVPDGASQLSSLGTTREAESVSGQESREEELALWNSVAEEAHQMRGVEESLDHETMQRFVSPVTANIEADDYAEYLRTELLYQTELSKEPGNALLLANYAQFLYRVAHDYDRAEEYFKKAVGVQPPDAEAYNKYATFLWRVRNDLWAAEETFLEAISVDPSNSFYAANYAHFLWNTGGEDTCFPLNSAETDAIEDA
ncbi:uncharacterized protein LOC103960770 [Pyrus x bretschneideri]|uniref:uncharacterized protein LOC103960770 n=1 Tax=Pyrus x bretschneideri TaxID=225117 RepID=UPI002030D0B0|nr:uncharacterized protein LOC103960770 [Pyrus x bretschneideri]